jgi:hypothetical protein
MVKIYPTCFSIMSNTAFYMYGFLMFLILNSYYFLNSIKRMIFVILKCDVFFEVRTEVLNIIRTSFDFRGSILSYKKHKYLWRLFVLSVTLVTSMLSWVDDLSSAGCVAPLWMSDDVITRDFFTHLRGRGECSFHGVIHAHRNTCRSSSAIIVVRF